MLSDGGVSHVPYHDPGAAESQESVAERSLHLRNDAALDRDTSDGQSI